MIPQAGILRAWRERPGQFVREVFGVTPDPWQDDVLAQFPGCTRLAESASKGPGKTATLAWLGWNFLVTRPNPRIVATSITWDNLADNLWTEMAKWQQRSELLKAAFTWTKTKIFANDHPNTWWMSARSWSKSANPQEQSETLAGLHEDYVLVLMDESGGIPPAILVAAEAILSSCKEGHIVQAGNTVSREGALYQACVTQRDKWKVIEISGDPDDPKRSPRVSVEWAREQIAMYGADNPWVQINVFGRFPSSAINALIGDGEIDEAMRRVPQIDRAAPRLLGVDVARQGDDRSVIALRQGVCAFPFKVMRGVDSLTGASEVSRLWSEWKADACFVDMTGGFGAGWYDQLKVLGRRCIGVTYSAEARDKRRFVNKRAEMYFDMVEWIKNGASLPPSSELRAALTNTCYSFRGDRMLLEPKELVKAKIGYSPDDADALAQTFAQPVVTQLRAARPPIIAAGADSVHWGI